jgi:hypothetical protein
MIRRMVKAGGKVWNDSINRSKLRIFLQRSTYCSEMRTLHDSVASLHSSLTQRKWPLQSATGQTRESKSMPRSWARRIYIVWHDVYAADHSI